MASLFFAVLTAVLVFLGGLLGVMIRARPQVDQVIDKSRDMIGSILGLVSLLVALVLGTLVGNTYYFSVGQQAQLQILASNAIQLDKALKQFGPDAKPMRDQLKAMLAGGVETIWGSAPVDAARLSVTAAADSFQAFEDAIYKLPAQSPEQKQTLASAANFLQQMEQTRVMISLQITNPFSRSLLYIVIAWSLALFFAYGLLSRLTSVTLVALVCGALAIGSAIFVILELSQPYTALFRISPIALVETVKTIDR